MSETRELQLEKALVGAGRWGSSFTHARAEA